MCSFLLRIWITYFYRERWLAWGDMGVERWWSRKVKNFLSLIWGFFERNKKATVEISSDLDSWPFNEYKGKKMACLWCKLWILWGKETGVEIYFWLFLYILWKGTGVAFLNQNTRLGLKYNHWLSVIVKKSSKVYGPSIKNFYDAWDDLGLLNLMTLGLKGFLSVIRSYR